MNLSFTFGSATFLSHPPMRPLPEPVNRLMGSGPSYFVDPSRGDDENKGTKESPWKTINRALNDLKGGETLYLRGRVYSSAGELEDPLRSPDGKQPDIGAIPYGAEPFAVGRNTFHSGETNIEIPRLQLSATKSQPNSKSKH